MLKYPNLFTPFTIGDTVFRNKIFSSPTGYFDFFRDGTTPTEDFIAYFVRKAVGGSATVCIGECHVDPPFGRSGKLGVDITDDTAMRFMCKIAEQVKRLGAVPSIELQHGGMAADAGFGPTEGLVEGFSDKQCHAMTEEQIQETIQMFANAAKRAKHYGFGMVTVHGAHGWLFGQFFSPITNKRTDRWGGSAENRARLAVDVCDAIHAQCGDDFPVEFRISVTELEDGYNVEEGVKLAISLDGHADIIHCSAGLHRYTKRGNMFEWAPSMFQPDGAFLDYAAEVKKHVKKSLVSSVGAHSDPGSMEEAVKSGKADIISVARALNCDPDMPNKARAGRYGEIQKCTRCFSCLDALFPSQRVHCALNPEMGRENEFAQFSVLPKKRRVLVAGGGIGGMQAAISCATYGHSVLLCEKTPELGGVIVCEDAVPFKKNLAQYLKLQNTKLHELGVEVRLNCTVTPEFIEKLAPEAVIAALGANYSLPPVEGADNNANVLTVVEAYANPGLTGLKTVIVGAGLSGVELGIYLSMLGKEVEIVEISPAMTGPRVQGTFARNELEDRGIYIKFGAKAERVTADGIYCSTADGEIFLHADTVVFATGIEPLTGEAFTLSSVSPVFHMIGDCAGGKSIKEATEAAHTIAGVIGR